MANVRLSPDSPEYAWVQSVVDGVGRLTDRDVRWNGTVIVSDDPATHQSQMGVTRAFHTQTDYLVLPREHYEQINQAIDRQAGPADGTTADRLDAREMQGRWVGMVEATGDLATQAIRLTHPMPERSDMTSVAEAQLDEGLGTLRTQDNLERLWQDCDSARIMPADGVPNPHTIYAGSGAAMRSTRDVVQEVMNQQVKGQQEQRPTTAGEFNAIYNNITDRLSQTPPDQRFQAVVEMIPGAERLDQGERRDLARSFREDFQSAVRRDDPSTPRSSAARAVKEVAFEVEMANRPTRPTADAGPGRFVQDDAMVAPHLMRETSAGQTQTATTTPTTGNQPATQRQQSPARGE